MIDFSGISDEQTKVLLYKTHSQTNHLLDFIFNFHEKQVDYLGEKGTSTSAADFLLYKTSDPELASQFSPTICFVGYDEQAHSSQSILSSITGGGIVIYPEFVADWDRAVLQTTNFFRKIPYTETKIDASGKKAVLDTEFGEVDVPISDATSQKEILGLMHFCQHMAIMEDEFYEALAAYF